MKVTCQRDALLAAVSAVGAAVAARSTRPILACIKAVAADDTLVLMGTDSELGLRHELRGVAVTRPGAAVLPPAKLASILKETSDADITLDADDAATRIRLSTGRYELPAGSPDEFPDVAAGTGGGGKRCEVTAGVLKQLIRRTGFAAERKESTRWAVTGVLWELEGTTLRLVATDTKRLALAEGAVTETADDTNPTFPNILVPLKAVELLARNLADDGESVSVILRANEALFRTEGGRVTLTTKLTEGRFVPYRDVLPNKPLPNSFTVAAADFLGRVRQAAITVDDEAKRVEFRVSAGRVVLSARGSETGSSEVELALPGYDGPDAEIALDPAYLTDVLKAIDGDVLFGFTDGKKPVVLTAGPTYRAMIMPLAG